MGFRTIQGTGGMGHKGAFFWYVLVLLGSASIAPLLSPGTLELLLGTCIQVPGGDPRYLPPSPRGVALPPEPLS